MRGVENLSFKMIIVGFIKALAVLCSINFAVNAMVDQDAILQMVRCEGVALEPLLHADFFKLDHTMNSFNLCNPSIIQTDEGFLVNTRVVNYHLVVGQERTKEKNNPKEDRENRNILTWYTPELLRIADAEFVPGKLATEMAHFGMEDCRIFLWNNELWAIFTYYPGKGNYFSNITVGACCIGPSKKKRTWEIKRITIFERPDKDTPEKNWLPFIYDNQLYVVYSYNPFTVMSLSVNNGIAKKVVEHVYQDQPSKLFRGSAGPIPFGQGYLLLVHEIDYVNGRKNAYYHRFVYVDREFNMIQYSPRFVFLEETIEFSCGMCMNTHQDGLLVGVGVYDSHAYLCKVPLSLVKTLLNAGVTL